MIRMHANENPYPINTTAWLQDDVIFKTLNRYPTSDSTALSQALAEKYQLDSLSVVVGNGSDELIAMILQALVPREGTVLSHFPTFSMYRQTSELLNINYVEVDTRPSFRINLDELFQVYQELKPALVLICNPNNPTGEQLNIADLVAFVRKIAGPVLVDEAYVPFAGDGLIQELKQLPNLMLLRTFSKAYGLAGIRVGYLLAEAKLAERVKAIKMPYNLNSMSEYLAIKALQEVNVQAKAQVLGTACQMLYQKICTFPELEVLPTSTNFIMFRSSYLDLAQRLQERGILIRSFSDQRLAGYYRVSVGTPTENELFLQILREVLSCAEGS